MSELRRVDSITAVQLVR